MQNIGETTYYYDKLNHFYSASLSCCLIILNVLGKILWNFQTDTFLFLVMKYIPGGNLYNLMQSKAGRLNYELSKLYYLQHILLTHN